MSILKMMFACGFIAAGVLVVSAWLRADLDKGTVASAAQPTPVVSVTTLPAMPGTPTTTAPAPLASATATNGPIMAPPAAPGQAVIEIVGDVHNPLSLTLKDLERMRSVSLTLRVVDPDGKGRIHTFTGVLLTDILQEAHPRFVPDPQTLMRKYVYVTGINGDSAVVGFPEFETAFNGKRIILAYLVDLQNVTTPGFAELVIPEDKTRARFLTVARLFVGEPAR